LTKDGHRLVSRVCLYPANQAEWKESSMHPYRTHTCAEPRPAHVGEIIRVSGWVHRKRDHGGVVFVDLRDHYGMTQIVADSDSPALPVLESLRPKASSRSTGKVKARAERR
jgi:aspartyl-tRNA synthetase